MDERHADQPATAPGGDVRIDSGRMRDWPALARIWRQAKLPDLDLISYSLRQYLNATYVARLEGQVVGFHILLNPDMPDCPSAPDASWLQMIAVDPRHQGRGIGRALIQDAEQRTAAWGLRRMEMACDRDNQMAIGINRSRGYELLDRPGTRLSWACHIRPTASRRPARPRLYWLADRVRKKLIYAPVYTILSFL